MQKYLSEARQLLTLAIPVIIAQVSQTSMGVVDTIMAGSYSATDMAAVAVGTSIWLPAILFGHGLLMALTPVVAQMNGSGRRNRIAHQVQQSFLLASAISVVTMVVLYQGQYVIHLMHNSPPELAEKAIDYLHALAWGVPGYLFYQVLRGQCEGLSKTKPGMAIGFIGLLVNIPINYVFIHGKLGMPEMGGVGCGVATSSVYWIMMLLLAGYTRQARWLRDIRQHHSSLRPDWQALKRLWGLGLPIALAILFEVTQFAIVALLVLPLGVVNVAGHQIALNFSSLMFVLPLSVGVAATIRVGHRLGEGSVADARVAAHTSIASGIVLAICTAIFTITLREPIAMLYNKNPDVVAVASHLMLLAAVYQISDAVQTIGSGVLRGYKDTRSIFFITFVSYWILGLPSGYALALTDLIVPRMGPAGFWCGFIIGLTSSAIMMVTRIRWLQRQPASLILTRASR
ncbi:MATE family efflux transporter [Pectobacteriaceae bacterium CE70]|nr:MATE family efflux transporter [Pectobacteriaceae bacterium C52]WJV68746.1 MATE family efflux transporter [Pectobacteriaceae bacterium CE70]WJY12672.1 MATE family efflux transporter [Pectobacteriaceae bacterium C80]